MSLTYAYYPGCSGLGISQEYEKSTRQICSALGVALREIPDWSCCGSSPARTVNHTFSATFSARNLSLVGKMGLDTVITPCPSCLANLKSASHKLLDPHFRQKVNNLLDKPCQNTVTAKSVLQILVEEVGLEKNKEQGSNSLQELKIAPYYGCIMNRPPETMKFDDPEYPTAMDKILKALGAEVIHFPLKVKCCGAAYGIPRKDIVLNPSGKLLEIAEDAGADAIAVACPLCQMNLDLRQGQINSFLNRDFNIPVFYYTQLMGLAFSMERDLLDLEKLYVDPDQALYIAKQRQQEKQERKKRKKQRQQAEHNTST